MNPYYLAIDIGASSGRHILAHLEDGKMVLEEVHRMISELRDSFRQAEKNCAEEAEKNAAGARS